ncbi:zinc finger protein 260 isoform X1 [Ixodes scapularis]|uniref:zinc finger protein 260 isoform X1 n=1 Tax=Ixodes scapularis TaxID=6945 RepID=UPI001A9E1EEF|nr:zinc finger protein 260 isoform X1 [Ixodes scapularis]
MERSFELPGHPCAGLAVGATRDKAESFGCGDAGSELFSLKYGLSGWQQETRQQSEVEDQYSFCPYTGLAMGAVNARVEGFGCKDTGTKRNSQDWSSGQLQETCQQWEDQHKCRFCPYFSLRSDALTIHERTHTRERPFRCSFCPKAFIRKDHRRLHERIHTGEKPFKCQTCHKAFGDGSSFIRHKRTHTREKPLKCCLCGGVFTRASELASHQKMCHS